jgi:hypothetical protein
MHIDRGFEPRFFGDDVRQQIYPFFRYVDSSLFPNDYIADYYLDCLPLGFRALSASPFLRARSRRSATAARSGLLRWYGWALVSIRSPASSLAWRWRSFFCSCRRPIAATRAIGACGAVCASWRSLQVFRSFCCLRRLWVRRSTRPSLPSMT